MPDQDQTQERTPDAPVNVELTGVAHGGHAVGRVGDLVAFVDYALPGEQVLAEVIERKPRFLRAAAREVLRASPDRVTAPCPIFGACGGCQWQHTTYERQLALKSQVLTEHLIRTGGFARPPLEPAIESPAHWGYRNTVQLLPAVMGEDGMPVPAHRRSPRPPDAGASQDGSVRAAVTAASQAAAAGRRLLCFQRHHSHDPVAVEHCYIADPLINEAITQAPWGVLSAPAWESLDHVLLRTVPGVALQITFVSRRTAASTELRRFAQEAFRRLPKLVGVLAAPVRQGSPEVVQGKGFLEYRLLEDELHVPAGSFFQVNLGAAEHLVATAVEWLAPGPTDTLLDAYAGVGTFTLPLARLAQAAIAVESSYTSAGAAASNAARAGLSNVQVIASPLEQVLERFEGSIDLVLVDPPRRGLEARSVRGLLRVAPRRIAYVSCEPSTLARDLRLLCDGGYTLRKTQVVDLFPQTYHLESISLLERVAP